MRKVLAVLLMGIGTAHAAVTTTGCGANYESALQNAKTQAVEQVTGTWMNGERQLKDDRLKERTAEYNGGVIKKYNVVESNQDDNQTCVTINAEVDVIKDNRMSANTADIPTDMRQGLVDRQEKYSQAANAVDVLNNKNKAFTVNVQKVDYSNIGNTTRVTVIGVVAYTPKWKTDVESLAKTVNQTGGPKSNAIPNTAFGVAGGVATMNPVIGAGIGLFIRPDDPKNNPEPMLCIADKFNDNPDECYFLGEEFGAFNKPLQIAVLDQTNTPLSQWSLSETKLYQKMYPGQSKYGLFGYKKTYENPTLVLYLDEEVKMKFTFDVPTQYLASVEKLKFVFN